MISIGIDVSKKKSMAFAMNEKGEVFMAPTEFEHTVEGLEVLVEKLRAMPQPLRVVLENTGYYHWPVVSHLLEAEIFVCIVNSILMNKFAKVQMRPGKTDKLDAVTICRFGLAHWNELVCCATSGETRETLRLYSRQYSEYMKMMTQQKVNFGCLLDKVMPGIQSLLCDEGGRSKLSDFVIQFWHFDRITAKSESAFSESYCKWAKKRGYHVNESKAHAIYALSQNGIPTLPCTEATRLLVTEAARVLIRLEDSVKLIILQMGQLASSLPEYDTVISMKGVGPKTAPRLIAEIGDVSRFHSAKALVAYAGLDAPPFQSGQFESKRRKISKRGDKYLRKVGYEIMLSLMSSKPKEDNAVYLFMCKKRAEGKYYLSAYMAGLTSSFIFTMPASGRYTLLLPLQLIHKHTGAAFPRCPGIPVSFSYFLS